MATATTLHPYESIASPLLTNVSEDRPQHKASILPKGEISLPATYIYILTDIYFWSLIKYN